MAEIFAAVAAALAAISLAVGLILLKRTKPGDQSGVKQDVARLTQMTDRALYISENSARSVQNYLEFLSKNQTSSLKNLQEAMENLSAVTEKRLTELQRSVGGEIRYMNEQNAKNLENIRQTVDEKLTSTLENRLNKSYSIINERLEAVYKGLGEVQQLAGSVADIKKSIFQRKTPRYLGRSTAFRPARTDALPRSIPRQRKNRPAGKLRRRICGGTALPHG